MDRALLDTDIFSEMLKGVAQTVAVRAVAYRAVQGYYTISAITVREIVKGLHKIRQEDRVRQFLTELSAVELLPFGARWPTYWTR